MLQIIHSREMDQSTAKCYSRDQDSYPCLQGHIVLWERALNFSLCFPVKVSFTFSKTSCRGCDSVCKQNNLGYWNDETFSLNVVVFSLDCICCGFLCALKLFNYMVFFSQFSVIKSELFNYRLTHVNFYYSNPKASIKK